VRLSYLRLSLALITCCVCFVSARGDDPPEKLPQPREAKKAQTSESPKPDSEAVKSEPKKVTEEFKKETPLPEVKKEPEGKGPEEIKKDEKPWESPIAENKKAADEAKVKGDTAWMLISSALVLLMVPGLALFYGGMVRKKNILATMMQSYAALAVVGLYWLAVGYGLAFGPSKIQIDFVGV